MLMVRAAKGPSRIHGLGLVAHEFIPRGTVVWEFQPGFNVMLPERLLDLLSPAAREQLRYYGYHDVPGNAYVLSSDDDRFCNHAEEPNTGNVGAFRTIAVRDIQPGEEITWGYGRGWDGTSGGRWTGEEVGDSECNPIVLPSGEG